MREVSESDLARAHAHYEEHGWARLGVLATSDELHAMRTRAEEIMLGKIVYEGLFYQLDTTNGRYEDLDFGKGWEGPSLNYRKIEKLEKDPIFLAWIESAPFEWLARRVYNTDISLYRALIFNKGAETGGSSLPWHQDGGDFWGLDREPLLQMWTALDDAPMGGGCIEVLDGSHTRGLVTSLGGVVPPNHVADRDANARALPLPAEAGEVIMIHNQMWHRSARSTSGKPRRALTACYMSAETKCRRKKRAPRAFMRLFSRETRGV